LSDAFGSSLDAALCFFYFFLEMGFGAFGQETRLRGGGIFGKIGGFINRITTAVKPFVGVGTELLNQVKPGLGTAIGTGFDIVDNISGKLKGGGKGPVDDSRLAKFKRDFEVSGTGKKTQIHPRVDSILSNKLTVPKRAPVYNESSDGEYESEEYD
jgi:hypothetical protein